MHIPIFKKISFSSINPFVMLVPAMNLPEIISQVRREYEKILATTLMRVGAEYDRERRKLKISKESLYPKEYEIKTTGKNNWIIFMHKSPGKTKYSGTGDIQYLCIVYFYSDKGLRVFCPTDNGCIAGYSSHFFRRYNERLGLKLSNPIDIVKAHFRNGLYCTLKIIEKKKKYFVIGFSVDGMRLGLVHFDYMFVDWKTFVSRDLTFPEQDELEQQLGDELRLELQEVVRKEHNPGEIMQIQNRMGALGLAVA